MVTPNPRGFPRTSNTAQVCVHVEDTRRKSRQYLLPDELPPERPPDPDLAVLFDLRHRKPVTTPAHELDRTPTATAYITTEERQFYLPTGEHNIKKDGSQGAEIKKPFILVTVTANIRESGHTAFFYRVTNRSTKVEDSRYIIGHKYKLVKVGELAGEPIYDQERHPVYKRKPIGEVFYELHRMCPTAMADSTADALAEWLQPPRERKPRKRKVSTDNTPAPPPIPALRSAANTIARMVADPLLDYLRQPLPFPDVKIS